MARSLVRILAATIASALILFAIAAMVMRQPSFARVGYEGPGRASAATLRRHVAFLSTAHVDNPDALAPYIAAAFRAAGGEVREQFFESRSRTDRNIIARFGRGDSPVVIVGAHYDAFAARKNLPGADDNASGTAGLLELARLLGAHR